MAELKIPLASNKTTLRKEDLSRAMFCALAISQEDGVKEVEDKLKQHPDLQFEEIHISVPNLDGEPIQKFVVASAEDIIFIAFQGMVTSADFIISDLEFDEQLGVNFHKGFFKRSNVFYRGQSPYWQLLLKGLLFSKQQQLLLKGLLFSKQQRVIFCGHSLGGAVSHMVLLRFLLENRLHHPKPDDYLPKSLESMISIAFGAPPLCDAKAATLVNDNPDFKWRFVNFVNQPDFVPCVLQRYRPDSAELQNFLRDISMSNTTNTEAVNQQQPSGHECTSPNQQGGRGAVINNTGTLHLHDGKAVKLGNYNPGLRSRFGQGAKEFASNLLQRTSMSRTAIDISDVSANSRDSITVTPDIKGGAEFHPIGQYIFLNQNGKNDVHRVDGSSAEMSELLKISQFDRASWERHKAARYKEALTELLKIWERHMAARYKEALTGSEDSAQPQPLTPVVKRPLPEVQYAKFRSTDEGDSYLKIRGDNLLFLSEAVSLNGMPHGDILLQTQNELWVSNPKEFSKQGASQDANYMVSIKTAFGRASRLVTEDFVIESGTTAAVNLLPKIWQCMLVKAQPPLGILPDTDNKNTLDEIIQCAFEQKVEKKLSDRLRLIAKSEDPSNLVKEADDFIKDDVVKNFLTSSLCISYETQWYTQEICAAGGGIAAAGVAVTTLTAVTGAVTGGLGALAGVLIVVAVASLTQKIWNYVPKRYFDSYEEVLHLAIREAKAWNSSAEKSDEATTSKNSSAEKSDEATTSKKQEINEEELERQVKESSPQFRDMVGFEKPHHSKVATICQLKTPEFQKATQESMMRFLRRIKMIMKTRSAYKVLAATCFVGILGAEDVGKSTFIKKAILKRGCSKDIPSTGLDLHTQTVRAWEYDHSIWLVDFPGGNGTEDYAHQWQFFTALPSIAILFLDFKDDIKMEQKEMYKHLKEELKTKVLIAFNKVDERYTPRNRSMYVADYFDKQKKKTAKQLKCDVSEIYYVSMDPDISDENFQQLKNAGVLDFDQFLEQVILLCPTMEPVGEKAS